MRAGVQAELFQTLGGIYQRLGNFDRADTLLQSSHRDRDVHCFHRTRRISPEA